MIRRATSPSVVSLLVLVTIVTPGNLQTSVCQLPGCICRNDTSQHDGVTDDAHEYDVICFVRSVALSDSTISRLPSDVSSIKLICTHDTVWPSYLTLGLFSHTPNIQHLGLASCHFFLVSEHVFNDISHLRSLELSQCRFEADLPTQLFSKSSEITQLTVSDCGLKQIPSLCGLARLEKLNVSHQLLSSIDDWVDDCVPGINPLVPAATGTGSTGGRMHNRVKFDQLVIVDVKNNSLSELPERLFDLAPNLQELYVSFNRLNNISYEFQHLNVHDAEGQKIRNINFMDLPFVSELRVLKIAGDGETAAFPVQKIKGLANMTRLHLENFGVDDSVWDVLPSLSSLTHLNLASNAVVNVSLSENNALVELNLTRNQIDRLQENSFPNASRLSVLDLSWNIMEVIGNNMFSNLTSLTHLYLHHNRLRLLFSASLGNLRNLQYLFIGHNDLDSLPINVFKDTTQLKELDISDNTLKMLPYTYGLTELFSLNLQNNQLLTVLATRLQDLRSLEFLFLRGNKLSLVDPAMFDGTPILKVLDLRENRISIFSPFQYHPTLNMILLNDNKIQDISLTFLSLPSLESLFIGNNYLTRLTKNMLPTSLRSLYANWNLIAYVDPHLFLDLPKLMVVSLACNWNLYKLTVEQVQVSPRVQPKPSLVISPNVFDCDCEMAYLKAWEKHRDNAVFLRDNLPVFEHLEFLKCFTHFSSGSSVFFANLSLSDFVCPYEGAVCPQDCTCCVQNGTEVRGQMQAGSNIMFDPACKCTLTCPEACACFHGGSEYVKTYTHVRCESRNLTEIPGSIPSRATHVRLDGNSLPYIGNLSLKHVTGCMYLYINNSQVREIEPRSFQNLGDLIVLDISHNMLSTIDEDTFGKMASLSELYLHHNHISYVHPIAFTGLKALSVLRLDYNKLASIGSFDFFPAVKYLTLASNPWSCACEFAGKFLKFLYANSEDVKDFYSVRCFWTEGEYATFLKAAMQNADKTLAGLIDFVPMDTLEYYSNDIMTTTTNNNNSNNNDNAKYSNDSESESLTKDAITNESILLPSILMHRFEYDDICTQTSLSVLVVRQASFFDESSHVVAIAVVVTVAVAVVVVGCLMVWRRREVQALVYDKLGLRIWDNRAQIDREQDRDRQHGDNNQTPLVYDAFVSYSHEDEEFVLNTLAPRLEEQGPRVYKLCLHYRDFPVGGFIADTIVESVESSRRTILLLSERFLRSEWCRFEFHTAHRHVLKEGDHRLIIVLLEDVKEESLDPDLKVAMKTRTYLRADDPWFWEKLCFAMPDVPRRKQQPRDKQDSTEGRIRLQSVENGRIISQSVHNGVAEGNVEIAGDAQFQRQNDFQGGRAADSPIGRVENGHVGKVDNGQVERVNAGQVGRVDDSQVGRVDGGQVGKVDDSRVERVDAGQVGRVDDSQVGRVDGGQVGKVDDSRVERVDVVQVGRVDDGQVERVDEGQVGKVDDGQVERVDVAQVERLDYGQVSRVDDGQV